MTCLITYDFLFFSTADYDMSCGICVCIPGYEMRGAGSAAHWEYEVWCKYNAFGILKLLIIGMSCHG